LLGWRRAAGSSRRLLDPRRLRPEQPQRAYDVDHPRQHQRAEHVLRIVEYPARTELYEGEREPAQPGAREVEVSGAEPGDDAKQHREPGLIPAVGRGEIPRVRRPTEPLRL